jgi:hypothetical protein
MKIVDSKSITTRKGKKELNAPEKWLFDKENKKLRLTTLMNMEKDKAAEVGLAEFQNYGTNKKSIRGFDKVLNQVFILGELPLIARGANDNEIVIRKLEKFDLEVYNKGDKKELSANHIEAVKSKLAEVPA